MRILKSDFRVVLMGGALVPNFGDELIVDSWLRWYVDQVHVPTENITIYGSMPSVARMLFSTRYPKITASSVLRKERLSVGRVSFVESVKHGYEFLESSAESNSEVYENLEASSLIHLHGGGYLNEKWPTHGFMLGLAARAKEIFGVRVCATGLGLHPLSVKDSEDAAFLKKVMDAFDVFEVRDQWSFDFCRSLGSAVVELGLDDVFLQPIRVDFRSGSTLHVSLTNGADGMEIIEQLSPAFVGSFEHHVFWSCLPADVISFERLSRRYPFFELLDTKRLVESLPTSDFDFMVTQRFHPHLVGARAGMRGVSYSTGRYYDVKHGSLHELGSDFEFNGDFSSSWAPSNQEKPTLFFNDIFLWNRKRDTAIKILR